MERKRGAEGTQVNSFKRCKLINYNRIGESPRITATQQKSAHMQAKTYDKIYLTLKEKEREREQSSNEQITVVSIIWEYFTFQLRWPIIRDKIIFF